MDRFFTLTPDENKEFYKWCYDRQTEQVFRQRFKVIVDRFGRHEEKAGGLQEVEDFLVSEHHEAKNAFLRWQERQKHSPKS